MSALPENPVPQPQSPIVSPQSHIPVRPQDGQQPHVSQHPGHGMQFPRTSQVPQLPQNALPETRVPCCGFSDIKNAILLFGLIHLILQVVVVFEFRTRYFSLKDGRYDIVGVVGLLSLEIYLAISVYSGFNAAAAFSFIWVALIKGRKATCLSCYLIGLILNFVTTALYWRIVPNISDTTLEDRSLIFNSSVVVALIYHICGFIFISSMLCEGRNGGQNTWLDTEPMEVSIQNPFRVSPGFQQQSPNGLTATAPSTL